MRTEREKLQEKIETLEAEHQRFQERIKEVSTQRRDLKKNLIEEKKINAQVVADMVDHESLNDDLSSKKFVEKVLQARTDAGSTNQLERNIEKLLASEQRCRERSSEIGSEIKDLQKQIRKLNEGDDLRECEEKYNKWYESVLHNEDVFEQFRESIKKVHRHGLNYQFALKEHGVDSDPILFEILASKMRPNVVGRKLQKDLIRELTAIKQVRPNKWYIHPSRSNERRQNRRKLIDPVRSNFINRL